MVVVVGGSCGVVFAVFGDRNNGIKKRITNEYERMIENITHMVD